MVNADKSPLLKVPMSQILSGTVLDWTVASLCLLPRIMPSQFINLKVTFPQHDTDVYMCVCVCVCICVCVCVCVCVTFARRLQSLCFKTVLSL